MVVNQGPHGVWAKEAAVEGYGVEEDGSDFLFQLASEPSVDRNSEAHLGSVSDFSGEEVDEGLFEDDLGATPPKAELAADRHGEGHFDDPVVEKRAPAF